MEIKKGELIVEGVKHKKEFKPPSGSEILKASKEQHLRRSKKDVTKGVSKKLADQQFIGFTAAVADVQDANVVYAKIKAAYSDARHVIAACRVPGRKFFTCQDFIDDDEHGAGSYLLKLLCDSDIQHRIVVVLRYYDGQHIGNKRFQMIFTAAKSAIEQTSKNPFTKAFDKLWEVEKLNSSAI